MRRVTGAERARRLHKVVFANLQNLAANESRVADPADNAQRKNEFVQAGAEKRHHRNRQQQTRKRKKHVEDVTRDNTIDPAAVITCNSAENRADEGRH